MKKEKGISLIFLVLSIILVIIIAIISGAFFINKKATSNNLNLEENKNAENVKDNSNYITNESDEKIWQVKDIQLEESFDAISVKEVPLYNGTINQRIAVTNFKFDINEIYESLKKDEYITQKYKLALRNSEYGYSNYYNDIGNATSYLIEDSIFGCTIDQANNETKYYNDFRVSLTRDTNSYENYKSISITFSNIDININEQEAIYNVLKKIIGEKYAIILVYAKDEEANEMNFEKLITKNETTYEIKRELDLRYKKVSFDIGIESLPFNNNFEYYDGNHTSIMNGFKYPVSAILTNKMGNLDLNTPNTFADKYMQLGTGTYNRTILDKTYGFYNFSKTISENGVNIYKVGINTLKGCSDISKILSQEFDISYTIYENENGIFDIELNIEGAPGNFEEEPESTAYNKLINIMKQQLLTLFPTIDTSKITYNNFQDNKLEFTDNIAILRKR